MESSPAVKVAGLTKQFGSRFALDGVSFEVPRGSVFGLVGPNGAGKTTLLRCLLGLARPGTGNIVVLEQQLPAKLDRALARTGALIEEPKFHRFLTGRENLMAVARLRGSGASERIPALLDRVGMTGRADDRVSTYSLGMRQRLALARCLLSDPELLVLDEPANGLDPDGILHTRELLKEFRDEGRTVIVSSHQLGELEKICDHVGLIDAGKLVHVGPLDASTEQGLLIACSDPAAAVSALAGVDGVVAAVAQDGQVAIEMSDLNDETRAAVVRTLVTAGVDVTGVAVKKGESLEELYLRLRKGASS